MRKGKERKGERILGSVKGENCYIVYPYLGYS